MDRSTIKQIGSVLLTVMLFVGCDTSITSTENSEERPNMEPAPSAVAPVDDAALQQTLAEVRSATAEFQDVSNAEAAGYQQTSPFVPGMGYHYVNPGLLDGTVNPTEPEALVYVDNPAQDDKRRLVAVEYIIPYQVISSDASATQLDDKFPGVDGDKWHAEDEINAWTLHAWIWYPNPEGLFHPTNPRVGS